MFVLTDLTHDGYLQIRKDRDQLNKKIQQYQALVDEFDLAIPFLEAIYEPKITIEFNEKINHFIAKTSIPYNNGNIPIYEKLGDKSGFIGIEDPKLIEKAHRRVMTSIKKQFPLHFQE